MMLYRFYTRWEIIFFSLPSYYFFLFFFILYLFFPSTVCPQRIRRWCAYSVFFPSVTLLSPAPPLNSRRAHRYIIIVLVRRKSIANRVRRPEVLGRSSTLLFMGTVIFTDKVGTNTKFDVVEYIIIITRGVLRTRGKYNISMINIMRLL